MLTQRIVLILAGYLFLAAVSLHKGTRWAKITNATIVENFGIALAATAILFVLISFLYWIISVPLFASLTILFMVKAVYKIPWSVASRAWIVHFAALLFVYAIGFYLLLQIL